MNDRIDVTVNQEPPHFHNSLIVAIVLREWRLDMEREQEGGNRCCRWIPMTRKEKRD